MRLKADPAILCSALAGLFGLVPHIAVAAPRIGCATTEYNFGEMESGLDVSAKFVINNDGDQPLIIEKAIPGCGCTRAKMSSDTIVPGGHAELDAVLSLKEQRGDLRKQVTLKSNDPQTPLYNVYLVGKATLPLAVTPERLMFGAVDANDGATRTIDLQTSAPDKAFHVTRVEVGDPVSTSARFEEIEKDRHYRVYVTLNKGLTPGELHTYVRIHTNNRQFSVLGAGIVATVAGDVAVMPSDIRLFDHKDKAGKSLNIIVSPARVSDFKITGVESPTGNITTNIASIGPSIYRITVSGLTPDLALNGKWLVVKTDIAGSPELHIPIHVLNEGHSPITTQPTAATVARSPIGVRRTNEVPVKTREDLPAAPGT